MDGCLAIAAVAYCTIHRRSRAHTNPRAVASAEDEVYEAVVRDMVTPSHVHASITQLVFSDTLLTEHADEPDIQSCKESVRKHLGLQENRPPEYNTLADKIYRLVTHGWYDGSPGAEAIQDFLDKSCTAGPLSRTFHTDLPRAFIDVESVHFNDLIIENGPPSFEQMFPGAPGIISFSHVGFDSTLHEAIVSSSFVCGGLCGSRWRYILRQKRGRWEVVG